MHPNAQYWIGNYFFVILFTFYWYFIVKLLSFLFSTTFFSTSFILLLHKKKVWQTFVQSSVAKRISEHKNRKKIISNPQSIIKFPSKWLESMNTLLFFQLNVLIEELRLRCIFVMRCDPATAWVNSPLEVKIFTENITVRFFINL